MNPNTMTIDDIRDELARRAEYVVAYSRQWNDDVWKRDDKELCPGDHPIPATLDEAAKIGKRWIINIHSDGGWNAAAWPRRTDPTETVIQVVGDTEMEARFRLRLACTLADEGSKT